jgi:hypothetical protein
MKALAVLLLVCLAPIAMKDNAAPRAAADYPAASLSDITTVGGFLAVCGIGDSQSSKFTMERVKHDPGFKMEKVFEEKMQEQSLCAGYSVGLYEGWKQGHGDGVLSAHLPDGIVPFPDIQPALKSLPTKELAAIQSQMHADIPCDAEKQTVGEIRDALVSYAKAYSSKNPFAGVVPMARLVRPATLAAFPCKK